MGSLGLMLLMICPAAAPEAVAGPRFQRGDELHYVVEVVETSDAVENRFRKVHALQVRLFVLETDETAATCALMTMLTRDADPALAPGMSSITQRVKPKAEGLTTVQLEFVRIDACGKVESISPSREVLPLQLAKASRRLIIPSMETDEPSTLELGFLLRTSNDGTTIGATWRTREKYGPETLWNAKGEGTWNGRRCWDVTARSASPDYERPELENRGWQTTARLRVSPTDGFALSVERETVRRFGRETLGKVAVKYELNPTNRYVGNRYAELRQEIETAWVMVAEFDQGLVGKGTVNHFSRAAKIQRYLDDHPGQSAYRVVLEALARRAQSFAEGAVPYVASASPTKTNLRETVQFGSPAPDFTVTDVDLPGNRFRLHAAKGKPVVLIFYKPNSTTSKETLTIAEALAKRYRDSASVVPLAIGAKPEAASAQRAELKYRVPVFDGRELRSQYRVETFPQFFLVDGKGRLKWSFVDGVGPEVGFLVKEALDKTLVEATEK